MKKVALIFRSKERKEFSIEALFEGMKKYFISYLKVEDCYLPHGRYNHLSMLISNYQFAKKIQADIYHISGEVYFVAPAFPKEKTVLTVHDCVDLENMHGIKKLFRWMFWYYIPFHHCKYIVCISHKVCEEIAQRFPYVKSKIIYAPNPVDDSYTRTPKEFNETCPEILVIGTRINKNIERIIAAVRGLSCKLHIIGVLSDEQRDLLATNQIEFTNHFHISDEKIRQAYIDCDLLCFPSTYEGFGRPIIEANAIGRPVLTSNIEPMLEVGADAALFVDPFSVDSIRNGVLEIINNEVKRFNLIQAGFVNAEKYKAAKVSEIYLRIYEEINK